jgi:hypothetical protein
MKTHDKLFKIELCKKKAAFTAKPQKNMSLNLDILKDKFDFSFESKLVLVLKFKKVEVIVHKHGELIFKNTEDEKIMEKIAKKIYKEGLKN